MHDSLHDVLQQRLRPWREIAEELIREPNTERMGTLLNELNQAFEDLCLPKK